MASTGRIVQHGRVVVATVTVEGKTWELQSNQLGNFPRTYIKANASVPVVLSFPESDPGQTVVLEAKDGGTFAGQITTIGKLDEQRKLAFVFDADAQPGIYRVSMRRGQDEKVLHFWVGEQQPVAAR